MPWVEDDVYWVRADEVVRASVAADVYLHPPGTYDAADGRG